jgi:L-alanine-DL-glutamate epimerase-like enolase superfamily enzyme
VKITDVRTVLVTGPSTNDPFLRESRKRRSAAFIEIHTDTELVGLGQTYAGYFCPELVREIVQFFKAILLD